MQMARRPKPFWSSAIPGEWMERLWSPAGATGGNRWQRGRARKPLKRADPQPMATHGNRLSAHGKEGVDGSSPSEGYFEKTKPLQMAAFLLPPLTLQSTSSLRRGSGERRAGLNCIRGLTEPFFRLAARTIR
jgi:hypothetical protein